MAQKPKPKKQNWPGILVIIIQSRGPPDNFLVTLLLAASSFVDASVEENFAEVWKELRELKQENAKLKAENAEIKAQHHDNW